ncbi:MAG: NAD(+)/NADH kinase [Gemmatimonadaceae bacterium]|nr:NAD(+)/NADH kinase [Gemmatimonadaceae bacterium]
MPETSQRIIVVLNPGSGGGTASSAQAELQPILAGGGFSPEFVLLDGARDLREQLDPVLRTPAAAILVGGGDGTISSVADVIHGRGLRLGVLPLGTLNHFARDLGIPQDLASAAALVVAGHTMPVDAASVNDRVFLNNSSVGLYARIVALRERYGARGPRKWLVATWATFNVMRRSHTLLARMEVDGRAVLRETSLIFIGNNEYRMAGLDAGTRASLATGTLALYVVKAAGEWNLLKLVWHIVSGSARQSDDLEMLTATSTRIDAPAGHHRHHVSVAIDGELVPMSLPLEYRILPAAFEVFVPR